MNMEERENNILEIRGLTKHYSDFTLQDRAQRLRQR